jgi:hypothetical protein
MEKEFIKEYLEKKHFIKIISGEEKVVKEE